MLRIISGRYKNLKIHQPDKKITRASSEKLREAVFSSIQFDLENKTFLDCFGGSGVFAFEAISRGASAALILEKNSQAFNVIKQNKQNFQNENITILNTDTIKFLEKVSSQTWDFIFIDPPYIKKNYYDDCIKNLLKNNFVNENTTIILESNFEINYLEQLTLIKQKKYGISFVSYWKIN
ncbi:16S rRNA (guanine(966)-N(2))-methyltransferase RsmD [Mycoplasma miroungirhinis]|uniref:16S rRNA (Guanine(966)-N(2))-methyltransferase RsmD n=1 Tax=Mycoplasma miroungirhinis TaxID=754516 RepID=A0A6M4JD73_9MOLU|nr:16S rRNA (guanine(966)-N(2))-methyltransferase RsmD [Mycoplasma miroungirhinis]QJR44208.1 16S rRNA (guanine(966)-N(2))-methyltransferase RsmD [Mycoplasma miroungirhinis]